MDRLALPDIKTCYKLMVTKKTCCLCRNILTDQWYKIEVPRNTLHTYGHLIDDGGTADQYRKERLFNKCCESNWPSVQAEK